MKQIIAIVRASTERQETESQRRELVEWIESSLRYPADSIRVIEVAGASAVKLNDAYLQMWEDVKSAVINDGIRAVALWDINRLGRNGRMLNEMKYFFIDNRVQVYFKNQGIELLDSRGNATIGGNIVFDVFSNVVEDETKEMFAKMQRGKARNKEQKRYNGGGGRYGVLFGYRLTPDNSIVIDNEEASQIRMVFQEYASGKYSFVKLAEELRDRGILFRGRKPSCNSVTRMLSDDAYKGYSSKWQRPYDPIIDDELWAKVEAVRDGKQWKHTKEVKHVRLALNVLSRCPLCGRKYIANDKQYMCYTTHSHRVINVEKCGAVSCRIDVLDGLLWGVAQIYHHKRLLSANSAEIDEIKARIEVLLSKQSTKEKEIETLNTKKEELADDYYSGTSMTRQQYQNRLSRLQARLESLYGEVDNIAKEIEENEAQIKVIEKPESERNADILLSLGKEEDKVKIRDIINQNIDHVDLSGDVKHVEITVTMKDGEVYNFCYNAFLNAGARAKTPKNNLTLHHNGQQIDCGRFGPKLANLLSPDARNHISDTIGLPRQSFEALLSQLLRSSNGASIINKGDTSEIFFK